MKADLCFGFSSTAWKNLVRRLDHDEGAWGEAIGVFERRMNERFFSCIDSLVKADTKPDTQSFRFTAECTLHSRFFDHGALLLAY